MRVLRPSFAFIVLNLPALAATFGTVVPQPGGFSDIVLDEARKRLYLVNTSANRVDVYTTTTSPPRSTNPVRTHATPLAAAIARSGKYLYVTCYGDSALDVIDLDKQTVVSTVSLPANPEGVAVGADGRVVITTIGTGQSQSTLLAYDPNAAAGQNLLSVVITPPASTPPQLPPPSGRIFLSVRSALAATPDGRYIIGVNGYSASSRAVFVYEVSSATVLRSRAVSNLSGVLSIAPDGSKFMAGISLFDTQTLSVLAQQNAANAQFAFPNGNAYNFNLQQNQGGSVFSPDGAVLYSAFNIAPVQNPPAPTNSSRLLLNDPDNLYINMGLQLPENLTGKIVITSDGGTAYALSESGFMVLPLSTIYQRPIAMPDSSVVLLENDQCGVTAQAQAASLSIKNVGGGARMTASAQLMQMPATGPGGLGGFGGPGGGGTGGGIVIILPPTIPGVPGGIGRIGTGGGATGNGFTGNTAAIAQTSPQVAVQQTGNGSNIRYQFNPNAARALGTVSPHDFLIQSPEAINIPPDVRVFQNNRNAEAYGTIIPIPTAASTSEGLMDMVMDTVRQRLYIANSGLNRIEVFDLANQVSLNPIKVGQLPHSLALGNDGVSLYVANSGSESVSVVDLDKGRVTGRVSFPPLPFNAGFSLITPSVIASSQRGPQIIMSDGTLWKVVGNTAVPRTLNPGVFGTARTVSGPVRTMASTPAGENVLLLAGNGMAYLYDAGADDYIVGRQVINPPIQGYFGPVASGPGGRYYLVNGTILNQSLTVTGSSATTPGGPGPITGPTPPGLTTSTTLTRPVGALAAAGPSTFARFSGPLRANANAIPADAGIIEMVDVTTGRTLSQSSVLEGPLASITGTQRQNVNGRTMAVDPSGSQVYFLSTSGLSIVPVQQSRQGDRPAINNNGVVSTASYLPSSAPGGLISIFGSNLAGSASAGPGNLPNIMGGTCVTLNNQPLPLVLASPTQINAQVPPSLKPGKYPLVVRSIDRTLASNSSQITVAKYAPAVFVSADGTPAILHQDGRPVTKNAPATRDERLVLYATGLGVTKGGPVVAGAPAPSNPLAVTDKVQVFFGNPGYTQAEIIVEWSGLVPGLIGLDQINLYVPGAHMKGDALPVTLRIGGVNSPSTGPAVPTVALQ